MMDRNDKRDILDTSAPKADYPAENLPNRPADRPRVDTAGAHAAVADHGVSPQEGGYFLNKFLEGDKPKDAAPVPADTPAEAAIPVAERVSDPELEGRIVAALQEIYDPEIPVNIYELGLIYDVAIDEKRRVSITMTLTTPHCPVAESMPGEVELKVNSVEGVTGATVKLVWEPAWDMSRMTDEARLELGLL